MSPEPDSVRIIGRRALRTLSRLRFTLLFLLVMGLANLAAGSAFGALPPDVLARWGIGHDALISGDAFRLMTGIFLSHDPDMLLRQLVFAGAVIGYTEWRRGSLRTAALFFGLDFAGTFVLLTVLGATAAPGPLAEMNDVGMSIGGFGLIGLAIAEWPHRRVTLGAILLAIAAKHAIAPDVLADLGHGIALGLGFALGIHPWALRRRKTPEVDHA